MSNNLSTLMEIGTAVVVGASLLASVVLLLGMLMPRIRSSRVKKTSASTSSEPPSDIIKDDKGKGVDLIIPWYVKASMIAGVILFSLLILLIGGRNSYLGYGFLGVVVMLSVCLAAALQYAEMRLRYYNATVEQLKSVLRNRVMELQELKASNANSTKEKHSSV